MMLEVNEEYSTILNPLFVNEVFINIVRYFVENHDIQALIALYSSNKKFIKIIDTKYVLEIIKPLIPIQIPGDNLYVVWPNGKDEYQENFQTILLEIFGADNCLEFYSKKDDTENVLRTLNSMRSKLYPSYDAINTLNLFENLPRYVNAHRLEPYAIPYTYKSVMGAVINGNAYLVKLLLESFIDRVNIYNAYILNLIYLAINHCHFDVIEYFLEKIRNNNNKKGKILLFFQYVTRAIIDAAEVHDNVNLLETTIELLPKLPEVFHSLHLLLLDTAAKLGSITCVKYLLSIYQYNTFDLQRACGIAYNNNHCQISKLLKSGTLESEILESEITWIEFYP